MAVAADFHRDFLIPEHKLYLCPTTLLQADEPCYAFVQLLLYTKNRFLSIRDGKIVIFMGQCKRDFARLRFWEHRLRFNISQTFYKQSTKTVAVCLLCKMK